MKKCEVADCGKPTRTKSAELCKMHYHRLYRTGALELRAPQAAREHSGGYIVRCAPGHPLVARLKKPYEYEHRIVYYDAHGEGPFPCFWCSKEVTWDTLHIDHLDDEKKNNRPDNLVASCPVCNQARGKHKAAAKMRAAGKIIEYGGRSMCVSEWARELGISHVSLNWRLEHGWPVEDALTKARGKTGPASIRKPAA